MILPDTCIWIEALLGTTLGERFRPLLRGGDGLIVPTIVQFELWKWVRRELSIEEADRAITLTHLGKVLPVGEHIALTAAELSMEHGLAAADAIIYACARMHDAELLTIDAHFEGLPGVRFVKKKSG
ncbi:MAG: type II toxin-antitoxin system VapC family toxin [Rhodocyclaceae bacterium]|nr:type II toxin-antitoxin system VapC family toxin [Rhodocyclaceae bacterium]